MTLFGLGIGRMRQGGDAARWGKTQGQLAGAGTVWGLWGPLAQAAISENSQTKFHALNLRAAILLRPGFIIGSVRNPSHLMCSCQRACDSSATALALLGTGKSGPGIFQLEERSSLYLNP